MGGSRLRSIGFMMMKTWWFLCVKPVSSLSAALQKYCTQPCFPRNVEGRPRGRPSLKGKLWMPADSKTDSPPAMKKYLINIICCSKMESVNNRSKMVAVVARLVYVAVASYTTDLWFESSHHQILFTINCIEKTTIKKAEAGKHPNFWNNRPK